MKPKKYLGQNWLVDQKALGKIVKAAELSKKDNVLEIGPGKGALTKELVAYAGRVIAIEKDEELARSLAHNYQLSIINYQSSPKPKNQINNINNFNNKISQVVIGDILEVTLPELIEKNNFQDYKVVANIPYYITGKIIRLLFETEYMPKLIVLLIQKEVAERICAQPGDMSILAVSVQYFGKPEIIDCVPKESFEPVPKVDSAILKIIPFKKKPQQNKDFFHLVKIGFASPRKTLVNNLSAGLYQPKNEIKKILNDIELDEKVRAEDLSIKKWQELKERTED